MTLCRPGNGHVESISADRLSACVASLFGGPPAPFSAIHLRPAALLPPRPAVLPHPRPAPRLLLDALLCLPSALILASSSARILASSSPDFSRPARPERSSSAAFSPLPRPSPEASCLLCLASGSSSRPFAFPRPPFPPGIRASCSAFSLRRSSSAALQPASSSAVSLSVLPPLPCAWPPLQGPFAFPGPPFPPGFEPLVRLQPEALFLGGLQPGLFLTFT